ncbi:MAG: PIG-L family deacetylase [Gemmatimonadaceae bacterium]
MTVLRSLAVAAWLVLPPRLSAQNRGAAALSDLVAGLGTTTRVLMIGAHPDDEDTQLIAYLAKARHVETAYLSLTRGDGGQNLIGNELGPMLGMIRTEELLAARRLDGGRQYFTRAYDFGFSKTLDETLQHWPKDSILKDVVEIVRAFRPQVIIDVWSGTPADGHGHHQYAGVVGREAFDAAADSVRFPAARAGGLAPWAVAKFYRLRRRGGGSLTFNVGEYDPVLGESYSELASLSRTQHRSQGQGSLQQKGPRFTGVQLEVSRVSDAKAPERGLFDGLDTSWTRFRGLPLADTARTALDSLAGAQARVMRAMDLVHPSVMVEPLAAYLRLVTRASTGVDCRFAQAGDPRPCPGAMGDYERTITSVRDRATKALLAAAAIDVEATAPREMIADQDTMPVTVSVYNRGKTAVTVDGVALEGRTVPSVQGQPIAADSTGRWTITYRANGVSTPWWLDQPMRGDMFTQPLDPMITGEDRLHGPEADVTLSIAGTRALVHSDPIVHRFADEVRGEIRRPVATVPEITVLLDHEVEYARANAPLDRTMVVTLHSAATAERDVAVSLELPRGLTADSSTRRVSLEAFGDATVNFRVRGRLAPGRDSIRAVATTHGQSFTRGFVPIEYEHIRPLRYYRDAVVKLEAVSATYAHLEIGYIRGVGDNVRPMLEELGLSVVELDPRTLTQAKLSRFTTIVLGSRAYESAWAGALVAATPLLMRFARDGGTVVTQYGKSEMARPGILPYPITLTQSGDRVTDESAPVRVLDPASPLLSSPNKIGESDFANWVQERSLYMPRTFDKEYRAVFSMNDKNAPPNDAAVLVAPVGKGVYVYTTLSFFRQLPAGNPGAARLFINLLSADARAANRPPTRPSGAVRP